MPGKYDPNITPYLEDIFEAVENPQYDAVVAMMASQLGKTDGLCLNVIGKKLDCEPVPILFVMPDQKMSETISNDRFSKMLKTTPTLWSKLAKGRSNKVTEKYINGARIGFAWASSASQLCSVPACLVFVDERDRMTNNVDGEGDPVEVVKARIKNYVNGKMIITSTPTIKGASAIYKHYEEGTRSKWCLPCPFCNGYLFPCRSLLGWEEQEGFLTSVYLTCSHCQKKIGEQYRKPMLLAGKYFSENPKATVASFWINGLCSYWVDWWTAGFELFSAEKSGNLNRVQGVVNTVFGEPFEFKGESIAPKIVADLRRPYKRGQVLADVEVLTCGIDVHKNNVHYVIRGWGKDDKSWLIQHGVILGDTMAEPIWRAVESLVLSPVQGNFIRLVCIDAGYRDVQVYQFCRRVGNAIPCKGFEKQVSPIKMARVNQFTDKNFDKKLYCIAEGYFKTLLMSKMLNKTWFLAEDTDDIYIKQITSEQLIVDKRGFQRWVVEDRDNHYLDCEKLNIVASNILHVDTLGKEEGNGKRIISKGIDIWH